MPSERIALMISVVLLAACESGPADSRARNAANIAQLPVPVGHGPEQHFEGVWQGQVTPADTMISRRAIALANGWGEFRVLTDGAQFVGFPRRTGSELQGSLTGLRAAGSAWSDGSRIGLFTFDGSIGEFNDIDASYSGNGDGGSLALESISGKHSVDIGAVQGTWVLFDADQNAVATFDFDVYSDWEARISGTNADGCTYLGAAESWTSYRSYDIWEFEVSGCPRVSDIDANGMYSGSAAIIEIADDGIDGLALVIGLSNDVNQLSYLLYRP